MYTREASLCLLRPRLAALRPLRPPAVRRLPRAQPFTQYTPRLLLTQYPQRPQLPYLSQSSLQHRLSPIDQQVLRFLSTDNRNFVRDYTYRTITWGFAAWLIVSLLNVMLFGLAQELSEQEHPTPAEWSFWTRTSVRKARMQIAGWNGKGYIDWVKTAKFYLQALEKLEDPGKDGTGTVAQEDGVTGGEIMIADVGSAGLDITGKSWEWRQGYYEVLMGMAQASENLDTMVRDTTRNLIFPKSTIIGPSNPDPRPVTKEMDNPPLEENCERAFDPPEKYYMRILTGTGFDTRQRVGAALAYANWLQFSGLHDAADEMLKWGVDIARAPLSGDVLNAGSYIVHSTHASENLLRAVTEYGAHQARIGNTATALPILLSVLRARQGAEVQPDIPRAPSVKPAGTDIGTVIQRVGRLFAQRKSPAPFSSGDEPFKRASQQTCEDSELMLYIGEIMFASSSMRAEGLSWTKKAVDIAEREVDQPTMMSTDDREIKATIKKCEHCFITGVENWSFMQEDLRETSSSVQQSSRSSWLPWSSKTVETLQDNAKEEADLERLGQLKQAALRLSYSIDAENLRKSSKFGMYDG
ncbi:hypothetical protein AMS68_003844 [Peltaster fructicola]|uniref:Uncharacterized protein n=1 Tax=Peltaster fructicola TaxID=286661 RepID=A0A6H0XU78_9PEZI|nr:hypothetical protein AMS68_003844 [Peltaster fructicola]